ncbi:hypothetical protein [Streptomyces sp. NPDC001978]|uniref:hypothetical protein n=1 Tax=Streptomyces sp. NPDC001978 TaxID=3364627 RepID=UPI003684354A
MRVLRTAAGRRALQLAVLAGGLFALGLLCGEQAHAADGTPSVTSAAASPSVPSVSADGPRVSAKGVAKTAVQGLLHAPAERAERHPAAGTAIDSALGIGLGSTTGTDGATASSPARPATSTPPPAPTPPATPAPATHAPVFHEPATHGQAPHAPASRDSVTQDPDARGSLAQATQDAVRSGTGSLVKPVGDLVRSVTQSLDEALAVTPALSDVPLLPVTGSTVPLPGLSELPGTLLPAPVTATPAPGRPGGERPAADGTSGTRSRTALGATTAAHEPDRTPAAPAPDAVAHTSGHRAAHPGNAPTHPAPTGDPDGSLGGQSALDNGGSRHIDAHAVTLNDRAPLRLVPGTAARDDAAGIRDRHRDIPVFPG